MQIEIRNDAIISYYIEKITIETILNLYKMTSEHESSSASTKKFQEDHSEIPNNLRIVVSPILIVFCSVGIILNILAIKKINKVLFLRILPTLMKSLILHASINI